jgi:hypothetical protein
MVGRLAAGHLTSPLRMHLADHLPSCVPLRYVVTPQWARDIRLGARLGWSPGGGLGAGSNGDIEGSDRDLSV